MMRSGALAQPNFCYLFIQNKIQFPILHYLVQRAFPLRHSCVRSVSISSWAPYITFITGIA